MKFFTETLGFEPAELVGATAFLIATAFVVVAVRLLRGPYGNKKVREACRFVIGYWVTSIGIAAVFTVVTVIVGDCEHHDPGAEENVPVDPRMTCCEPGTRTVGSHVRHFLQLSGYTVAFVPVTVGAAFYFGYRALVTESSPRST